MEETETFISYLAGTNEAEYQNLYTFAVDSLTFANKVHIFHWSCDSGFHHTHFQTVLISDEIYNKENALRKLRFYIDEVEKLSEQFKSKVALNNLMSDTVQKLENEYGLLLKFT